MDKIGIGLIGFGTVGTGVVKVLEENRDLIRERLGVELYVKRIACRDRTKKRAVEVDPSLITTSADEVIRDPEVSIVVELVGGTQRAKEFVLSAIEEGKPVVTANKALLSEYGREVFGLATQKGVDVGFEASVGGGIPIIKALKEGLCANRIESITGIINGTANYILTRMTEEGGRFEDVLKDAQQKGYAEADPTYDIEGIDTAHKLAILVNIAFGTWIGLDDIYTEGISHITELDVEFARELGYRIKLLAIAKCEQDRVEARVHPTMIPTGHPLSAVGGVYNAVHIQGNAVGSVMLYGMGAGMMPTASAVVSDIMDIARNMLKGVAAKVPPLGYIQQNMKELEVRPMDTIDVPYYLRFSAIDRPGVLSRISGVFGAHNISIASVIQKGRDIGGAVPLVIITHHAKEKELRAALGEIEKLDVVTAKPVYIRIEESSGEDS